MQVRFLFALVAVIAAPAAQAAMEPFHLTAVRVSGMYAFQGTSQNSYSGEIAWTPGYWFSDNMGVRLDLGASLLKSTATTYFAMFDYEALFSYSLTPSFDVEAGGGGQTWASNGGTAPAATGDIVWKPSEKIGGAIDRIFARYTRYFLSGAAANEIFVGLGFGF